MVSVLLSADRTASLSCMPQCCMAVSFTMATCSGYTSAGIIFVFTAYTAMPATSTGTFASLTLLVIS